MRFAAILAGVCYVATATLGGCNLFGPTHTPQGDSYALELKACVASARTISESKNCRAAVDCRYGQGPCPDAGP